MKRQQIKKIFKTAGIILSPLVVIYLGISFYFINHFYFNTTINNVNVSGQTIQDAASSISEYFNSYELNIEGRNNLADKISGVSIDLNYNDNSELKKVLKSQNSLLWIKGLYKGNEELNVSGVSYNEHKLKSLIDNLEFLKAKNIIEPQNASFECEDNKFHIVDEVMGTVLKRDILQNKIEDTIKKGKKTLNLEEEECYENPKYTKESKEIIETNNKLNSIINFNITYNIGDRKEIVDGDIISKWIDVSDDFQIKINEDAVKKYVYTLASKYNTFGGKRMFKTTDSGTVSVAGGNYGWIVDQKAEVQKLIEDFKENKSIEREPIYSQTAVSRDENDIGNTYVEINLTKQHLWFYKDGVLITEGDVVTGNASLNTATPAGVYRLNYKEKDATLKGENYSSDVTYWMPFNNNIGIHDASWRNEFGGQIYLTSGSHGCVNAPYDLAQAIFAQIEPGTPIICYN